MQRIETNVLSSLLHIIANGLRDTEPKHADAVDQAAARLVELDDRIAELEREMSGMVEAVLLQEAELKQKTMLTQLRELLAEWTLRANIERREFYSESGTIDKFTEELDAIIGKESTLKATTEHRS